MPPEAPSISFKRPGNPIFYDLLRPSFVKNYSVPLCSDALSGWCSSDPNHKTKGMTVVNATRHLYEKVLPRIVAILEGQPREGDDLIDLIHREGGNCRHLGHLRVASKSGILRHNLLLECMARTLKNELRHRLRDQMVLAPEPYRIVTFEYLKLSLCYSQPYPKYFQNFSGQFMSNFIHRRETVGASKIGVEVDNHSIKITRVDTAVLFTSDTPISASQGSFFIEVTEGHNSLSTYEILVGFIQSEYVELANQRLEDNKLEDALQLGLFFSFKEARFYIFKKIISILPTPIQKGHTVGILYSQLQQTILFILQDKTIGDEIHIPIYKKELLPVIIVSPIQQVANTDSSNSNCSLSNLNADHNFLSHPQPPPSPASPKELMYEMALSYTLLPPFNFPINDLCATLSLPEPSPDRWVSTSAAGAFKFWSHPQDFKAQILKRFPNALEGRELSPTYDLRKHLNLNGFIKRFSSMSGVKFSERVLGYMNGQSLELDVTDIVELVPRVSTISIVEETEAKGCLLRLQQMKKKENIAKTPVWFLDQLIDAQHKIAKSVGNTVVEFAQDYYYWGLSLYELGLHQPKSLEVAASRLAVINNTKTLSNDSFWEKHVLFLQGLIFAQKSAHYNYSNTFFEQLWVLYPTWAAKRVVKIHKSIIHCSKFEDCEIWFKQFIHLMEAKQSKSKRVIEDYQMMFVICTKYMQLLNSLTPTNLSFHPELTQGVSSLNPPTYSFGVVGQMAMMCLEQSLKDPSDRIKMVLFIVDCFKCVMNGNYLVILLKIFSDYKESILTLLMDALTKLHSIGGKITVSHLPSELSREISKTRSLIKEQNKESGFCPSSHLLKNLVHRKASNIPLQDIKFNDKKLEKNASSPSFIFAKLRKEGLYITESVCILQLGHQYDTNPDITSKANLVRILQKEIHPFQPHWQGKTRQRAPVMPQMIGTCLDTGYESISLHPSPLFQTVVSMVVVIVVGL
eukprot:TRINITY_DN6353_c0_g1_i9.p1 TRINITY_DN6353_c0_g1~~TRINITY_DN6353_c0_g1_i9.p1  ORF type:complete len:968 (-),score=177.82 TRINITY_DN6353_c0_g1_i9:1651-4554(-)